MERITCESVAQFRDSMNFTVGQRVVIIGKIDGAMTEVNVGWVGDMDNHVGKLGEIVDKNTEACHIKVDGTRWWYPYFSFAPVGGEVEEEEEPKKSKMDRFRDRLEDDIGVCGEGVDLIMEMYDKFRRLQKRVKRLEGKNA